jgi:gamma-glutamylcyclotransferase
MISPHSVALSTKNSIRRFSLSHKTTSIDSGAALPAPQAKPESLYFAYGSNLQLAQMAQRCPESRYMGIAYLHGYKFQINQRGYANVIPSSDDVVAGLCYLLSAGDEARLDVNEGVRFGAYEKEFLDVEIFLPGAAVVGRRVSEIIEHGLVRGSVGGGREEAPVIPKPRTPGDQMSSASIDFGYNSEGMRKEIGLEPLALVSDLQIPVTDEQAPPTGQQRIQNIPGVTPRGETLQALVYISRQYTTEGSPRDEYVDRMNLGIKDGLMLGVTEEHVEKYLRKYIPLGKIKK